MPLFKCRNVHETFRRRRTPYVNSIDVLCPEGYVVFICFLNSPARNYMFKEDIRVWDLNNSEYNYVALFAVILISLLLDWQHLRWMCSKATIKTSNDVIHIETSQIICSANQLTGFYLTDIVLVSLLLTWTYSSVLNCWLWTSRYC